MLKYFLNILFVINAFATQQELVIDSLDINYTSDNYLYFIKEDENHNTPEKVLHSKELKVLHKSNLGPANGPFWTKITIKNNTNVNREFLILSNHPGVNYLNVYIYKNTNLIKQHLLGDLVPQNQKEILEKNPIFSLNLTSNEEITIIAKFENYGIYRLGWEITDNKNYIKNQGNSNFLYGILSGLIIFYVIYTFLLYVTNKKVGYLLLLLEAFFINIYILSTYGILYKLNLGISLELITLLAFIAPYIATISRILFVNFFFDLHKNYKYLAYTTFFIAFVCTVLMFHLIYGMYYNIYTLIYMKYHFLFYIIYPIIFILISIHLYTKKEAGLFYFILGQFFIIITAVINTLTIFGYLQYQSYSPYILNIGLILDAFFMLFLQQYRLKKEIEIENKNKEILLEQSRFFSIGQTVGNIVHQWKQPISYLGGLMTVFEALLMSKNNNIINKLEKDIPIIQATLRQMASSLNEFDEFYKTKSTKEFYVPKKVLEKQIIPMLQDKITLKNINIQLNISEELKIFGFDYQFSNIMSILLNNSIDAFNTNNTNNTIEISIIEQNNLIQINCSDNAGGIKIEPIEKIFEYFTSKKNDNEVGHGIGLAMIKILIENQLNGTISVENIANGAKFCVKIPVTKSNKD